MRVKKIPVAAALLSAITLTLLLQPAMAAPKSITSVAQCKQLLKDVGKKILARKDGKLKVKALRIEGMAMAAQCDQKKFKKALAKYKSLLASSEAK